jgi:bla regulator protein blaR1
MRLSIYKSSLNKSTISDVLLVGHAHALMIYHRKPVLMELRMTRALVALLLASCGVFAQPAAAPLKFEVASIKPSDPNSRMVMIRIMPGGRFQAQGISTKMLIEQAYNVRDFQISGGPGWIGSDHYNINAEPEIAAGDAADNARNGNAPNVPLPRMSEEERQKIQNQLRQRLQSLLADRFQLKIHKETKQLSMYVLVVGKNGPKIRPSADSPRPEPGSNSGPGHGRGPSPAPSPAPGPGAGAGRFLDRGPGRGPGRGFQGVRMAGPGQFSGSKVNMAFLAQVLSQQLGQTVVDKTGLTGDYDFDLKWTPDRSQAGPFGPPPPGVEPPPPADPNGPSIFTAVQEQLGLKLESQKGPVEIVVIDQIEKPSGN